MPVDVPSISNSPYAGLLGVAAPDHYQREQTEFSGCSDAEDDQTMEEQSQGTAAPGQMTGGHCWRTMTLAQLQQVFHMPRDTAAVALGISLSALKKACVRLKVKRWPYRKLEALKQLQAARSHAQHPGDGAALDEQLEKNISSIINVPNVDLAEGVRKELRRLSRRRHNQRVRGQGYRGYSEEPPASPRPAPAPVKQEHHATITAAAALPLPVPAPAAAAVPTASAATATGMHANVMPHLSFATYPTAAGEGAPTLLAWPTAYGGLLPVDASSGMPTAFAPHVWSMPVAMPMNMHGAQMYAAAAAAPPSSSSSSLPLHMGSWAVNPQQMLMHGGLLPMQQQQQQQQPPTVIATINNTQPGCDGQSPAKQPVYAEVAAPPACNVQPAPFHMPASYTHFHPAAQQAGGAVYTHTTDNNITIAEVPTTTTATAFHQLYNSQPECVHNMAGGLQWSAVNSVPASGMSAPGSAASSSFLLDSGNGQVHDYVAHTLARCGTYLQDAADGSAAALAYAGRPPVPSSPEGSIASPVEIGKQLGAAAAAAAVPHKQLAVPSRLRATELTDSVQAAQALQGLQRQLQGSITVLQQAQ